MPSTAAISSTTPALTLGFPWWSVRVNRHLLGRRLIWWPRGIPDRRRIGIMSSRLGRQLDRQRRWFDLLRTAVLRIDAAEECLCVVQGTAAGLLAARAARLLNKPLLLLTTELPKKPLGPVESSTQTTFAEWMAACCLNVPDSPRAGADQRVKDNSSRDRTGSPDQEWSAWISPCFSTEESVDSPLDVPFPDRLQFAVSSRLYVLKCSPQGNTERLILQHLRQTTAGDPEDQPLPLTQPVVYLADNAAIQSVQSAWRAGSLLVRWLVQDDSELTDGTESGVSQHGRGCTKKQACRTASAVPSGSRAGCPLSCPQDWLLHWTRACDSPWPGQTQEEWLDELILGLDAADHSACAALIRIAVERRLRASSAGIRGGYSVVAFTAVPLAEFRRRRIFRRHRQRFDFEPWGVGIRRKHLEDLGAAPVIYGTDDDWQQLPAERRPWYQKAVRSTASQQYMDEREWRIAGDVVLENFLPHDLCFFVDHQHAANILASRTRSQVLVVPNVAAADPMTPNNQPLIPPPGLSTC